MANRENDLRELMPLKKRHSLRFELEGQNVVDVEPQQQVEVDELQANQELPERVKSKIMEMGGTEEILIFERTLSKSDVDKGLSRLSIPISMLLNPDIMTSDEKEETHNQIKGDREGGLSVEVIDPSLKVWELKMRKIRRSSTSYLLAYKWNHVVEANSLTEGDKLKLWSFRSQQKLCLALVFR